MKQEIIICDECRNECVDDFYFTVYKTGWDGIVRCKEDICKNCFSKMYKALKKKPNHDGMKEGENDEV